MPYGPHTDGDRADMLEALGLESIDPLFDDIPASVRAHGLDLPGPEPEMQLAARLERLEHVGAVVAGVRSVGHRVSRPGSARGRPRRRGALPRFRRQGAGA
jgi:glycine cleavage system pyridoxal-binding protein P